MAINFVNIQRTWTSKFPIKRQNAFLNKEIESKIIYLKLKPPKSPTQTFIIWPYWRQASESVKWCLSFSSCLIFALCTFKRLTSLKLVSRISWLTFLLKFSVKISLGILTKSWFIFCRFKMWKWPGKQQFFKNKKRRRQLVTWRE